MSQAATTHESQLQKAMQTLTAQWYNAVIKGCSLDSNTFQLVQGNQTVGTTSETLWQFFDAVPPLAVSHDFDPSQYNSFSSQYGSVVMHLIVQGSGELKSKMGDYYSQWLSYAKKNGVSLDTFKKWAMATDPSQAPTWISLYRDLQDGAIFQAQLAWHDMLNASTNANTRAYDKTIADLNQAIRSVKGASVDMNSAKESSNISNTWAEGEVGGIVDDFFGGAEGSYSHYSEALASSHLTLKASFQNLVTFAAGPLAQPSHDPILQAYTPWYNAAALSQAYKHNNNRVWEHGTPTWEGVFGTGGSLRRMCSALVVVDGIDIEVHADGRFSKSDETTMQHAASGGFFPFFEAESSSSFKHEAHVSDDGGVTLTSSSPTGNPQVLGVIVTPIEEVFGGSD